jgi:transposase
MFRFLHDPLQSLADATHLGSGAEDHHCCRIATRYDKLAANYTVFVKLASAWLWLRLDELVP